MKKIIVAIDLSEETKEIIDYAKNLAKSFGAKLFIVHSESVEFYINSIVNEEGVQPSVELIEKRKKIIQKQLDEVNAEIAKDDIESECILMEGPTVDNILQESEKVNAELIILGSHKHGRFYHLLFGSIHNKLIRKTHIPVMVIPTLKEKE